MCDNTRKDCRAPEEGHKKDAVWYNNMLGSKRNYTWQVVSIPESKPNVEETKTYYK